MVGLLFSGLAATLIAPFIVRLPVRRAAWLPGIFPAAIFAYLLFSLPAMHTSRERIASLAWVPSLEVDLTFRLDGLGFLFSLLIALIGLLVVLYASDYLQGHPQLGRFYAALMLFMTAMLGVVWSDHLLGLFVFWELTSISSYLLIGFNHEEESSRKAALQALLVTGGGGLALLAGLVLLGLSGGTFALSTLNLRGEVLRASPAYPLAVGLILLGALTKSAQFPFHFWLPGAMAAPTPVSAYLHSATMVKAGVYLLARLNPALGGTPLWNTLLVCFGLITLAGGAFLALSQHDLKRLLAYTTVGALGGMVFLLGIGTPLAVKAALTFLLAHALYKGALFLVAGGIDHATHTRDIRSLSGLARAMPWTASGALLAGASMFGLPPTFGFVAKELLYESTLAHPAAGWLILFVFLAMIGMGLVSAWVAIRPFLGPLSFHHAHENSWLLWGPPLLLGSLGILAGWQATAVGELLIQPAATAILGEAQKVKLSLWHGITPYFLLSLATMALAAMAYLWSKPVQKSIERFFAHLAPLGPERGYRRAMNGLIHLANFQTNLWQNGYLRVYILFIILTTLALATGALLFNAQGLHLPAFTPPRFYEVLLIGIILAGVGAVVRTTSRLATIALLGTVGLSISLIYLLYSAPDLAIVQFAVETLTVILFVLVIYRLPKFTRIQGQPARWFDLFVALAGGTLMTLLVLLVTSETFVSLVSPYFNASSLPLAKGRNVVNVILVDFRGFDTLGEITVLSLAAIGVFALLRLVSQDRKKP
ncbi:multisubunit sodium/proton antiporter, MrpA subunit [Anaerolinea thermolimosa]|uniref:putative monovalent cation/H+ antiporter subunit A n=1 Tax=Anaerolinea thermolimosa TaxID=229919 RepID=UPI00078255F6|nr:putative monovalent cation/H+ antiporter subunit A [Anaerolinea thermolimosa]GAP08110.1 multisubunit sodium/proton antiporter, MrpA subunit [Anaerolinea thermolimosa]